MVYCEIIIAPRYTILPVLLIILYLGGVVVSIINTGVYFQKRKAIFGVISNAHLAFCVIGAIACLCFSSVMWVWSSRYSVSHSDRIWRLTLGIWAAWALKDLPLFVIEIVAIMRVGFSAYTFQLVSFIVQVVFVFFSTLATSATYSWYISGALERAYSGGPITAYRASAMADPAAPPPLLLKESPYALPSLLQRDATVGPYDSIAASATFNEGYQDTLFVQGPRITPPNNAYLI